MLPSLQKSFSLGKDLATARYSDNLLSPTLYFPSVIIVWTEEPPGGLIISLSYEELTWLSVGYGGRSPLCGVTGP